MSKFNVGFTYTATGHIDVEADTFEEAEEKAQKRLEELQSMGEVMRPDEDEIQWNGDEVEVW